MRAILTYHSIDTSGSPISVSPTAFRAHVGFLARGQVRVVPLSAILTHPAAEDAVAITFDDGFANFAAEALPILSDHGFSATVFVVSEHVGRTNEWDGEARTARHHGIPLLPLMSWETLGRTREQGVEVGAHSRRHPDLTTLSRDDVHDELAGSKASIAEALGEAPSSFAYPYGKLTPETEAIAAVTFERACSTDLRILGDVEHRARLPRIDMYYFREAGQFESWGTAAFTRRLWIRAQGRRVRALASSRTGGP